MTAKKPNKAGNGRKSDKRHSPAAYFLSLALENVRCFGEKQSLDLSDGMGGPAQWTILLGDNGTGKTTVLQAFVALNSSKDKVPRFGHWHPLGISWAQKEPAYWLYRGSWESPGRLNAKLAHGPKLGLA